MSSTSQLTDFSDLYTDLQQRVRVATGVTATENQAKRYINIALQDMHIGFGEKFPWAEETATLTTQNDYSTGTIAITKGDTVLTGTSTLWATANDFGVNNMRDGGKIVINGGNEVYEIASVTDDDTAALTSDFVKTTVTAASYVYFEDEYALDSNYLRPIDLQYFDQNRDIRILSRTEFRREFIRNKTVNKIRYCTFTNKDFSSNTTPVKKVRFAPPPDDYYKIDYSFVTNKLAVSAAGARQTSLSADADEPIVPFNYRHAIVFHALYHWYRDKKDDNRARDVKGEYEQLMVRIAGDNEIGSPRPQFRPRVGGYARSAKVPYSRRGNRHTLGNAFDQLRTR